MTLTLSEHVRVSPDQRLHETGTILVPGEPALMTIRLEGDAHRVLDLRPDVPMIIEY